jgi:hypothetical protein
MAVRHTDLTLATLDIDGNSYLTDWQSIALNTSITTVDGRGGSDRYAKHVEVKGAVSMPFELLLDNTTGGARTTNLNVSLFTLESMDLLADIRDFTISFTNGTSDGSGMRDRWQYPNYVGGSEIRTSGTAFVPFSSSQYELITNINSGTAANRAVSTDINFGADRLTMEMQLISANLVNAAGAITTVPFELVGNGAPTSPSTSTLFGRALTGTEANSLFTAEVDTGAGVYTLDEAIIQSMTVTASDGALTRLSGVLLNRGAITWAATV